jgi:hypothetical protein
MAEDFGLEKLKKQYEILRGKYSLPSFKELNEDFEIEKLQDKETDILSKEIRRTMVERNLSYLRFIEMFLNPANAPVFFLALVKTMDTKEKAALNEIYLKLGKFELESIKLDNEYDEKKDAEFIKHFHKDWQDVKLRFGKIMENLEKSWEKEVKKGERGYLG